MYLHTWTALKEATAAFSSIHPDYVWGWTSFAVNSVSVMVPRRSNLATQSCVTVCYVEDATCRRWLACLRHASVEAFLGRFFSASCLSVHSCVNREQLGPNWTDFIIFDWWFLKNRSRKWKFIENLTRIKSILHEDEFTFFMLSRWILNRMKNVLDKSSRKNQNTHLMFSDFFFQQIFSFRR